MGMNSKPFPEAEGAGHRQQEVTSQSVALEGALAALQQTKVELEVALRSSRRRSIPAGETSIFLSFSVNNVDINLIFFLRSLYDSSCHLSL